MDMHQTSHVGRAMVLGMLCLQLSRKRHSIRTSGSGVQQNVATFFVPGSAAQYLFCFFPKHDCNVSLLLGPLLCLQLFKSGLALVRMFRRIKYAPSTVRQSPVTIRIFPGHLSDNQMIASLSEGCPSPFHDLRNAHSQLSSVEMLPMWKI